MYFVLCVGWVLADVESGFCFLSCFESDFQLLSLMPRGHILLSFVTKVCKSTLSLVGPKVLIITVKVLYYLFLSTISAHLFRWLQSVLIGDYEISALCFQGALFRTSLPLG